MDATTLSVLAMACAPLVHPSTTIAIVTVESNFNPHAIGVVGGVLDRQPRSHAEALVTVSRLQSKGWDVSVGLAQINARNFARLGLNATTAFDPCENLRAMQSMLGECFDRAAARSPPQTALRQALSCYYSGNFVTGFRDGYVQRVMHAMPRGASAARPTAGGTADIPSTAIERVRFSGNLRTTVMGTANADR